MALSQQIKINLLPDWKDCTSENESGIPTYIKDSSSCPGPLQISFALYKKGQEPNPTYKDLLQMSIKFGISNNLGTLIEELTGDCAFGKYGTAVFSSDEYHRVQIWHLSNGKDFILATHICPEKPDQTEVSEANKIVLTISKS